MATRPHRNTCEIRLHGILSCRDLAAVGCDPKFLKKHYLPGEVVIQQGITPEGIFLLLDGQAVLTSKSGRRLAVDAARSDASPVFGLTECLSHSVSDMRLTARTRCELAHIDADGLDRLLLGCPDICLHLAAAVGRSYAMAVRAIRDH